MPHEHDISHHHSHHAVSAKTVKMLLLSFAINMLLSLVEIIGGIIAGSVALIGDALHNTCDALSLLIAVISFKIGNRKASAKYTFGFRRAETIGGLVNLVLLFISGCYLLVEGCEHLIFPQPIAGKIIIWISVLALIIDAVTAKISHHDSHHNYNMKMVFIHNLADALGSVGVIISGLCIVWFGIFRIDGVIAILIAFYMIYQSVVSFPAIVNILMNAAPEYISIDEIKREIMQIADVRDVHHIHLWCINEDDISIECHVVSCNMEVIRPIRELLRQKFAVTHCNIQVENSDKCFECEL